MIYYFTSTLAFFLVGVFPILFYYIKAVNVGDLLFYRFFFCVIFLALYLVVRGQFHRVIDALRNRVTLRRAIFSSTIFLANLTFFNYAVISGQVFQLSLGYLIAPIISVIFSRLFLKEELSMERVIIVFLLTLVIIVYSFLSNHLPNLALYIAFTWSLYGFYQKKYPQDPSAKSLIEPFFSAIAILVLVRLFGAFGGGDIVSISLDHNTVEYVSFLALGIVTVIILVLFNLSVKHIPLRVFSILQYVIPIVQLLVGLLVYHEQVSRISYITYFIIFILAIMFIFANKKKLNQ